MGSYRHSHLMFFGQRIIPNIYIQSHLYIVLLLAYANFYFLVLHGTSNCSSKHTHHLKQVSFLSVNSPYKHVGRGHDLFSFAFM